jgi:methylated-DNA-protein-cysteine methyltransferase related protein
VTLINSADVLFESVYAIARTIPVGRVMAYSQVGDLAGVRPRGVGRAMALCVESAGSESIPWHRVVGADGSLRIGQRSPELAIEQRRRLENEGVCFSASGRVLSQYFSDSQ